MPISASSKKALRVAEHKTSVNRHRKALVKEALKNVSAESLPKAIAAIDKSAKWGIIHPNKAARLKSRLTKSIGNTEPTSKPKKAATKSKKAGARKSSK